MSYEYGLDNCKEKHPPTKSKIQERRRISDHLVNPFCWKEESKADFVSSFSASVAAHWLPMQIFQSSTYDTEKKSCESLDSIFELYEGG